MANKQIPKTALVGPFQYRIEPDCEVCYAYDKMAMHFSRNRKIGLNPNQPNAELPQSVLHEILHALGSVYEIPQWAEHNKKRTDKIDLMATALLKFMQDNPSLINWLVKGDKNESGT